MTCRYALSSFSAQVTLVIRSLTYACTVSYAGREPVLRSRTDARTVPSAVRPVSRSVRSAYSIVV